MLSPTSDYYRLFKILGYYTIQVGLGSTNGIWHEIVMKLEQFNLLERKIRELNTECGVMNSRRFLHPLVTEQEITLAFIRMELKSQQEIELGLLAESFYHLGWALRELLREIPGLEAVDFHGINQVRNRLLLHQELPHNKNYGFAFGCGGTVGPIIKPDSKHTYRDYGLYENIDEMKAQIFKIRDNLDPASRQNLAAEFPDNE